jgi:restriction system protein
MGWERDIAYILARATTPQRRNRGRVQMYQIEVRHEELNKYRLIKHSDPDVLQQMANSQWSQWDEIWQKRVDRESKAISKNEKKEIALSRTKEAQESINQLNNILISAFSKTANFNWEQLKDRKPYPVKKPTPTVHALIPSEPVQGIFKYNPQLNFFDHLFSHRKAIKIRAAEELFKTDHEAWVKEKDRVSLVNKDLDAQFEKTLEHWQQQLAKWESKQKKQHKEIDAKKQQYLDLNSESVIEYTESILSNSVYPDWFPQDFDIDYNPTSKTLIVDYNLPDLTLLPKLSEVKYIASSDTFKETMLSDSAINKLYDPLIYQITLRTIYELYATDAAGAIDSIVFNGCVTTTDLGTGHRSSICIISVQSQKEEFSKLNLREVDPKACFKKLKGVGSSKLHGMAAVAPIVTINREDSRFVKAHDVAHLIDDSVNIAAMDWQEFEHLIREIFEKEFSKGGGEVKITRASRDRGVDAIAFDPDPIRGGKIVIQAKRYTNSVDVAAVRDLYGTVVNEGATKGILVTTSDYGPDAYAFAKDKPLTLLNGSNLLHLLGKHGHKAKIDLAAAKIIMSSE